MKKKPFIIFFLSLFLSLFFTSLTADQNNDTPEEIHIVSIPKSGTHLILKIWDLLSEEGYRYPKFWMHPHFLMTSASSQIKRFKETFSGKKIYMIRDPRDIYVSAVYWMDEVFKDSIAPEHTTRHWLPKWQKADFEEKLLLLIDGKLNFDSPISLVNFNIFASLPQLISPDEDTLVVRFEDLVGSKGGGSDELQYLTLKKIFDFCGYDIPEETVVYVANNLFGDSYTFRKGEIGSWKEDFTRKVKAHFKHQLGGALILMGYEEDKNW